MSQYAVELRGISKRFRDKVAVNNVDLQIRAGSVCGFLGPNGAGKTTTIRMIMSIFYPDKGSISVLGKPSAIESKDQIGYLPEERGVYKKMKVGEFLNYMGRLKGMPGGGLDATIRKWLERMSLGEVYKKKCEELSKGMQQKVQFIASVIHEPELIILDEPFSGLDPVNRRLLRGLIEEQNTAGRTVIFSTHAMFEAEQLCDHLFMINKGDKVLDLPIEEVWRQHDPRAIVIESLDGAPLDATQIDGLAGVRSTHMLPRGVEVRLEDHGDPSRVMGELSSRFRLRRVELKRPSLDDIFISLVGESATPEGMAADAERELVES
ncbi:MAG: ABC transporter ATP-binding protein [Phycisphaerales bacterium]